MSCQVLSTIFFFFYLKLDKVHQNSCRLYNQISEPNDDPFLCSFIPVICSIPNAGLLIIAALSNAKLITKKQVKFIFLFKVLMQKDLVALCPCPYFLSHSVFE